MPFLGVLEPGESSPLTVITGVMLTNKIAGDAFEAVESI